MSIASTLHFLLRVNISTKEMCREHASLVPIFRHDVEVDEGTGGERGGV